MLSDQRLWVALLLLIVTVGIIPATSVLVGCNGANVSTAAGTSGAPTAIPAEEEILTQLDNVLEFTSQRKLNTDEHAAWQILHGALAYQRGFLVDHEGKPVSAVDHILAGGRMSGWTVRRGYELPEEWSTGNGHGLQAILEQGSKAGQGHADQWFAVLAQCELSEDQAILVDSEKYTMESFLRQIQLDCHRNAQQEFSWTLIGLTSYLPTSAKWKAADGSDWNIEKLVEIEAKHDVGDGACGGTHRLIGLSMALNRHLQQGGKLEGPWKSAEERIQAAIKDARNYQNADGSFSTNYLMRGGASPDTAQNLGTTGHVLEFLALSLTDEQLKEPWVKRAVLNLCGLFRVTKKTPLECGALYHAAHGLLLYRERVFGPRTYGDSN